MPFDSVRREQLRQGIEHFNREEFFDCHEILETAWRESPLEEKTWLQGLIQVAVALHHLRRGNATGASKLLIEGTAKLSRFVPRHEGVEVAALLESLGAVRIALDSGGGLERMDIPKIVIRTVPCGESS